MAKTQIRALAHLLGTYHNIVYYAPEVRVFRDHGIPKYWHAYLAYRSAPMGRLDAGAVTATFYNFAPSLVEAAIPAAWDHVSPAQAIELRDTAVQTALTNAYRDHCDDVAAVERSATEFADALRGATTDLPDAGRVLFAGHRGLPVPDDPLMRLWHATTLWREFRGDGHNIALAAEGIDGLECHLLLAGKGVASRQVIEKIRGWDSNQWEAAHGRLLARGLLDDAGVITEAGRALRSHIEDLTDRLTTPALDALAPAMADRLIVELEPIVGVLVESGIVPDRWPPPKLDRVIDRPAD